MNPTIIPRLVDPTYDRLVAAKKWQIPDAFNMGTAGADVAPPDSVALVTIVGRRSQTSFGELSRWSDQLAAAVKARGVGRGDRIGLVAPQLLKTGLSHLAVWKLGSISFHGRDAKEAELDPRGSVGGIRLVAKARAPR